MYKRLEERLRSDFIEILYYLAGFDGRGFHDIDDREMCLSIYNRFEKLYNATLIGDRKFRPYDSDIFIVLSNISNRTFQGDILNITSKLEILFDYIENYKQEHKFNYSIVNKIKKLYDKLSLEKSRIDYFCYYLRKDSLEKMEDSIQKTNYKIESLISKLDESNNKVESLDERIEESNKRIQNAQKEVVAILGIFTSIVLTFIGGGFLSSSIFKDLSNINRENIYLLVSIFLILSLVIFNILISLYYFIIKIVEIRKSGFKSSCKEYILLFVPNIILIVLLVVFFSNAFK